MLEFRVLECWSFEWTLGVDSSSLREGVNPLSLPFPPFARGIEKWQGYGEFLDGRVLEGLLTFWRWLIRKPFRLGLVCRLPLPG